MKGEIAKSEKFVLMRNGIRIYLDNEEIKAIEQVLKQATSSKFIGIKGRTLNTADISGVFLPADYEQLWHEKRGEWQCKSCGAWLDRKEKTCSKCQREKLYPKFQQNGQ